MIPPDFTGGWARVSISLDGAAPFEDTTVWWLQAASKHADLRVPLSGSGSGSALMAASDPAPGVMAFAGTTHWEAPSLTWVPEVELDPSELADTGVMSWDGEDMLEAGETVVDGRRLRYVERWRRLPGTASPLIALSAPDGRLVRAGELALTVIDQRAAGGAFRAVAWRLVDGEWTTSHCWPPEAKAPAPPTSADLATGAIVTLDDGSHWTVDEAENRAVSHD